MVYENLYTAGARYYDLLVAKKDVQREIKFITKLFKKLKITSLLDVGCGTGLYLIPLKRKGFDVEGLDLSAAMLKEARKKDKKIKVYKRSMLNFKLKKRYDAIICLSSTLISVKEFKSIKKTLKAMSNHLNARGILLIDLPNHTKEIKEQDKVKEQVKYTIPKGTLTSTFFSYKQGNKWVEEWYGEVKEGKKIEKFKCIWKEFIYAPKKVESYIEKLGFKKVKVYGSMTGRKFDKSRSYRSVYLYQKK